MFFACVRPPPQKKQGNRPLKKTKRTFYFALLPTSRPGLGPAWMLGVLGARSARGSRGGGGGTGKYPGYTPRPASAISTTFRDGNGNPRLPIGD
jgi:hypothetical protein